MKGTLKAILLAVFAVSFVFCILSSESDDSSAGGYGSDEVGAHKIVFDSNGGTGGYTQYVLNGNSIYLPTEYKASGTSNDGFYTQISKSGYVLTGWKAGNATYYPGQEYTVTGNVTFTAQWQDLTYDCIGKVNGKSGDLDAEAQHLTVHTGVSPGLTVDDNTGSYLLMREVINRTLKYTLTVTGNGSPISSTATSTNVSISADWLTLDISKTGGFTFSGTPSKSGIYEITVKMQTRTLGTSYGDAEDLDCRWYVSVYDDSDPSNICHVTYGSYDAYGPYGTAVKLPDRDSSAKYQNGWNITVKGSPAIYPIGGSYTVELKEMPLTASTYDADSVMASGVVGVIAYNANGGYYNGAIADLVASEGTAVLKNSSSVTKSSYTFLGWNKTGLATDPIYPAGYVYSAEGEYTELTAVWGNPTGSTVKIYCNNPGDGNQNISYSVYPGYTYVLPVNGFNLSGYDLKGWSETSYDPGKGTADAGESVKITAAKTYYAVFKAKTYTYKITFVANNGTSEKDSVEGHYTGTLPYQADLIECPWTREGYHFVGWAETKYADSPSFTSDETYTFNDSGEVTLYAVWVEDLYKFNITYCANNGTTKSAYYKTSSNSLPMDVTLSGCPWGYDNHYFAGWSKDKDAKNPQYRSGATYTFNDSGTAVFYAVWSDKETLPDVEPEEKEETETKYLYLIVFNGNGTGVTNVPAQICTTTTSAKAAFQLPSYGPSRDGYNFSGWSVSADSVAVAYQPRQTVTMEMPEKQTQIIWNLYAVWTLKSGGGESGETIETGIPVTVNFIVDNGVFRTVSAKTGQIVTEAVAPDMEGYYFLGWYDGDTAWDFSKPVTGSMTLNAKYLPIFGLEISGTSVKVVLKVTSSLTEIAFSDGFTAKYTTSSIPAHTVAENSTGKVTVTVKTEQGDYESYRYFTVGSAVSGGDDSGDGDGDGDGDEKEDKSFEFNTVETVAVAVVGLLAIFVIARRFL